MWFLSFDSEREARRIAVLLSNEKFGIHVTRAHYRGMATPSNSSNAFGIYPPPPLFPFIGIFC